MDPEKVERKKKIILYALRQCLLTNVYSQISFNDVADMAEMSKGGIRHYFPTKESLFIALIDDFFKQIEEEQIQLVKAATQFHDKALLSTMYSIEKFLMNQDNVIILMNIIIYSFEDVKIMDIVRSFLQHHLDLYESILKEHAVHSETEPGYIKQLSRTIQVLLLSAGLFQTIDPIDYDPNKLVETVISLFSLKRQ
ncbi:MAG: TetR/AcrR family transcriptional regulator [Spirochaetota bacterium]